MNVRQRYRLLLPYKKHSREAIYYQLRISNSFVTFRYQPTPAARVLQQKHFQAVENDREKFSPARIKYEARQISDLRVRVYGNTAIVTGRAMQKGVENAKDYSGENRFTRVYVKKEGRWVSVALQVTLVAKP